MASNSEALADPSDGDFNDWFELYNPGTNAVNLAGYYLTDTLTNRFKYQITTNGPHLVPAQGYLLVWADNEPAQNLIGGMPGADLHVNFPLAAGGEAIGLFAPDGTQIDAITFGLQPDDVSMGRYPDGSANVVSMPGSPSPRASNFLGDDTTPPAFGRWSQNGNALELTWNTRAGQAYAVDYKDDLGALEWTPLWTNVAAGSSLSFTNVTTNAAQRFFRIRVEAGP
jgi:hypothetical protein